MKLEVTRNRMYNRAYRSVFSFIVWWSSENEENYTRSGFAYRTAVRFLIFASFFRVRARPDTHCSIPHRRIINDVYSSLIHYRSLSPAVENLYVTVMCNSGTIEHALHRIFSLIFQHFRSKHFSPISVLGHDGRNVYFGKFCPGFQEQPNLWFQAWLFRNWTLTSQNISSVLFNYFSGMRESVFFVS